MKKLIEEINRHNYSYYTLGTPTIPDHKYDELYDKLVKMELETGFTYSNSPTQNVGYDIKKELVKYTLKYPLKSLSKTKDIKELEDFVGNEEVILMVKGDGLTNELVYRNGVMESATTRGNGEIGELITENARNYQNVLVKVEYDDIVVVGEAMIMQSDFFDINRELSEEKKFANPRNAVSGAVRQLNPNITKKRKVSFMAFGINGADERYETKERELGILQGLGFDVVPYVKCTKETLSGAIDNLKYTAEELGIPFDGMVVQYNKLSLKETLGATSKFPRWAKAFKFTDEEAETVLKDVIYDVSRNGVLTPVAVFEPVDLEGTEVERASLHNLSIMKELELGIGDEIVVYKANQIIPQLADNNTRSNTLEIIKECPVCSALTEIKGDFLYCSNENCSGSVANKIAHFCSREAMNIKGFSVKTIEKMINNDLLSDIHSIYSLKYEKEKLYQLEGMGKKSVDKLLEAIENSREIEPHKFLYGLGISQIGLSTSKVICKAIDIRYIGKLPLNTLRSIDGLGDVASQKLYDYRTKEWDLVETLFDLLKFKVEEEVTASGGIRFDGKTFVITGSVHIFKNRNEIKDKIEALGGKVTGSVTGKTNYLINNDKESESGKNKKALELDIPIINEEDFINMMKF